MKISHVRYQIIGFLVFRFHSDDPGGRDLINLLTSGGQNIESMIISHVRYQIIDFLVYQFHSKKGTFWTWIVQYSLFSFDVKKAPWNEQQ